MSPLPLTAPLIVVAAGAVLVYLLARLLTQDSRFLAAVSATILALALVALLPSLRDAWAGEIRVWPAQGEEALLIAEPGGMLLCACSLLLGLTVVSFSGDYLALDRRPDRFYPLVLLLQAGTLGMALASNLFTLYLFIVLTSVSSYILVAFRRGTETAIEAGYKYAVTGSMASILALAGIAYLLRATGSLSLPFAPRNPDGWHLLGLSLLCLSLVIKGALFPAHIWLPDAHGRAPSSVSALLSGIVAPLHLYLLLKLGLALDAPLVTLGWLLVAIACGSMLVGSLMSLRQSYGKRLLGYSTISQVGYATLAFGFGLVFGEPQAIAAGLVLLVAHALLKGLAFMSKGVLHFYCGATQLDDLDGLWQRAPVASGLFAVALVGLAGMPPLAGFAAKAGILWSLARVGHLSAYLGAGVLLVSSLISLGAYLPLIARLLRPRSTDSEMVRPSPWMQLPLVLLALGSVILGLWPTPIWEMALRAARFLLTWGAHGG